MTERYHVIVVDPPWEVRKVTHKARPNQVNMDYATMGIDEIKALPIGALAADDCWCFLWTTQKFLFASRDVLTGWGFSHLLTMVWEKTYGRSAGMPLFGFRWNGEFILVGYRAKPRMWPTRALIPTVFSAENIKHSQKPERFYKLVAPLGQKRIDIFARTKRDGWDALGDAIDGKDIRLALCEKIVELGGEEFGY